MKGLAAVLPDRALALLEVEDLRACHAVCADWRKRIDEWAEETFVLRIQIMCNVCIGHTTELQEALRRGRAKARFEFLEATLRIINAWEGLPVLPHVGLWQKLCIELFHTLEETEGVLERVSHGGFEVNENFDVFELSLRRYHQNIHALACCGKGVNMPTEQLISDVDARRAWMQKFGARVVVVSWKLFKGTLFSDVDRKVVKAVKFLVNFPKDNLITAYKFDLLVKHFGPFCQLTHNIALYALGLGFAGLINRIHAKKLLSDHWSRNPTSGWYLIRLSRTEPAYVVFSVISRSGTVTHALNKKHSIREKILKNFSDANVVQCMPVRMTKDAYEHEKISAYAMNTGGYVTIDESEILFEDMPSDAYQAYGVLHEEDNKARKPPHLIRNDSYSVFDP